jgi:hypothetical protein
VDKDNNHLHETAVFNLWKRVPVRRVEGSKPQSNSEFMDNQLITSKEQSPYTEAYSRSTAQETDNILRDLKVHYRGCKTRLQEHRELDPVHNSTLFT